MWEALAAIAGVLGALVAIVKYLLTAYFKKANELEKTKKYWIGKAISELETAVDDHKKELRVLKAAVEENTMQQTRTRNHLTDTAENWTKYIKTSESRISEIESRVLELGNALIMVTKHDKKEKN
jgi:DNA repair exonuclease SbcCD ATPase subunit